MTCKPYTTTVKPGDGWYLIARRFGVPAVDLAAANGATIRTMLHPGMELVVPGRCAEVPPLVDGKPPYVLVVDAAEQTVNQWPRHAARIIFIIVHDPVAGSVPGLLSYLRSNDRKVAYDEVQEPGAPVKVHRISRDENWVGHAGFGTATDATTGTVYGLAAGGNLNPVSLGYCLFKHRDDNGPFSEPMLTAAVTRVADLAREHDVDPQNILSHAEVDPTRRHDPRGLSMPWFRARVIEALHP